jgi:hypothetical protein
VAVNLLPHFRRNIASTLPSLARVEAMISGERLDIPAGNGQLKKLVLERENFGN